jgi:copper chaperone
MFAGMTCGGCERSVQTALTSLAGVLTAKADRVKGSVTVEYDPALVKPAVLAKAVTTAGFAIGA